MKTPYEEYLDILLGEIKTMLLAKHHDYGTNNLKKHGLLGIAIRVDDKIERINNLLKSHTGIEAHVNETVEDTFLDIAGYAIQAVLLNQGKL